jgi:WD40 repeat protein
VLGRHKAEAVSVTFSPDGAYLFTGGWERELICWDVPAKRRLFTMSLDSDSLQISADGRRCATRTRSGIQLHAFERPAAHREFAEDLGGRLRNATFSADGRWLAASADKRMGVWDLSTDGPAALDADAPNGHLFFTPDRSQLFSSGHTQDEAEGFRWRLVPATNPAAPPRLERLPLHKPAGFTSLSLNSDFVVMSSSNGSVVLAPEQIEIGSDRWARTSAGINSVSPDGRWLGVFRPFSAALYVYRLPGLERVAKLPHPAAISDFEFSPLGDEVAVCSSRAVELWSTETWQRTRTLTNFSRLLYPPEARALWLVRGPRTAGLYDSRTLEPQLLLPAGMLPVAISANGRRVAVSVDARRLQVWDLAELRNELRAVGLDWGREAQ